MTGFKSIVGAAGSNKRIRISGEVILPKDMTPGASAHTGAFEVISYFDTDYTDIKTNGIKVGSGKSTVGL